MHMQRRFALQNLVPHLHSLRVEVTRRMHRNYCTCFFLITFFLGRQEGKSPYLKINYELLKAAKSTGLLQVSIT